DGSGLKKKRGGGSRVHDRIKEKTVTSHPSRRGKDEEPLVDCIHKEETHLLGHRTSVGFFFTCAGCGGVFDQQINPLIFSYQTDFQLSSSSGNGLVEQKFACELLSLQKCASYTLSWDRRKWRRDSVSQPVYTSSDVR
ncbi:hypothetical protein AMECASPLE_038525, partial [Ameca splendens]